jgi:elongation factor P--beta-lysine ligase
MNSNFKGQFIKEYTLQFIRQFFIDKKFHEIETPTLLPFIPIEPNLYPLKTIWAQRKIDFYLPTSPESSLKKVIAKGVGNCFTIAKVFRDLENIGPTHNLEFSMLEWYEIGKTHHGIAITTQELILNCYHYILKRQNKKITNILHYQNQNIDLSTPWYEFTLSQLFKKYANIDLSQNLTAQDIIKTAKNKGYNVDGINTWEPLYTQIFINEIESKLPQDKPVIIFDYPTSLSPLCKRCSESSEFSQRFEFYIGGMEIGNAYTELTNSKELEKNFIKETNNRKQNNLPFHPYDKKFVKAVGKMPECAGIGLGVDRLAMLFTNAIQIEDVLYFPISELINN